MFGRNIPIKPVYSGRGVLRVVGVWSTIQGEGPFAGMPAIFIRLAGCNLRCFFCDTDFESNAREVSVTALAAEVRTLAAGTGIELVVLTGGEPLAQPVTPLVRALSDFLVQAETAGTVWQEGLEYCANFSLVCSPKTSAIHPEVRGRCENFKYIVRAGELDPEDGLPCFSTQEKGKAQKLWRPKEPAQIWLQPCDEYLHLPLAGYSHPAAEEHNYEALKRNISACIASATKHGYRISFQLHKVLGVE